MSHLLGDKGEHFARYVVNGAVVPTVIVLEPICNGDLFRTPFSLNLCAESDKLEPNCCMDAFRD